MPEAIAREKRKKRSPAEEEDAFVRAVLRAADWVNRNQRAVIYGLVAAGLVVGAAVYYVNYRSDLEERGSIALLEARGAIQTESAEQAISRLEGLLARFGGTEAATQARVMLGRIYLRTGAPGKAIDPLREAAEAPPDHPLGYSARVLLADAHEALDRPERAAEILAELARSARFEFQRRQAAAERARILVELGRLEAAEGIYERLVAETGEEADGGGEYALELGRVRGMIRGEAEGVGGEAGSGS